MSVVKCRGCDKQIDLDKDSEHFTDNNYECCHPESHHMHLKDDMGWGVFCGVCLEPLDIELDSEIISRKERSYGFVG